MQNKKKTSLRKMKSTYECARKAMSKTLLFDPRCTLNARGADTGNHVQIPTGDVMVPSHIYIPSGRMV